MTEKKRPITDVLGAVARIPIKENHFNFTLKNTGNQALEAIQLRLYSTNDPDDPGTAIASTDAEFSSPASGSAIQLVFQDDSSGEPETIAPNTLPAGSVLTVGVALRTEVLKGYDSYEVQAKTPSGTETTLSLFQRAK